MSVAGEINGLFPTPVRLRLFAAVRAPGRIYGEAGQVWDKETGYKVMSRVAELLKHGWIEAVPREGYRADWSPQRTYCRPADSDVGRAAIERGRR